jgi:23S rRNA (pseudouridine1915-N3)-methyltransferase
VRLLVAAVGHRMPAWVDAGFADYAKRMPRELPLALVAVKAEPRSSGKPVPALLRAEADRLRAALPARCRRIALDEHGGELTTRGLADRLAGWTQAGEDVAFLIGGPDGLDPPLKAEAAESLRLSGLTLPHALVRVILAEALYRAGSLLRGHPYHRE